MSESKTIIRQVNEVAAGPVDRAEGAAIQVLLGPQDKMPNFYLRLFTLEPGGSIPKHRHETIEHEQMILSGEMVLILDDREVVVKEGDVVYLPAREAHAYQNRGTVPARFLCAVPAIQDYTTEWL